MTDAAQSQDAAPLPLITQRDGSIFHIVFNRPEKRNALTAEMFELFAAALTEAERDSSIHVVILRAAGRDFCAGFDLSRLRSDEFHEDRFKREEEHLFNRGLMLRNLPKPTIAAITTAIATIRGKPSKPSMLTTTRPASMTNSPCAKLIVCEVCQSSVKPIAASA